MLNSADIPSSRSRGRLNLQHIGHPLPLVSLQYGVAVAVCVALQPWLTLTSSTWPHHACRAFFCNGNPRETCIVPAHKLNP